MSILLLDSLDPPVVSALAKTGVVQPRYGLDGRTDDTRDVEQGSRLHDKLLASWQPVLLYSLSFLCPGHISFVR
jgi:hypothetical protein